jgi:hypothetical protein
MPSLGQTDLLFNLQLPEATTKRYLAETASGALKR